MEDHQTDQASLDPPPPSYSIARETNALTDIQNITGTTLILAGSNVKLQHKNEVIYSLNHDPRSSAADSLTFSLQVYKHKFNERNPKITSPKELYSVEVPGKWWNPRIQALLPPIYTFSPETRSFYCYRPGCQLIKGNVKWLKWVTLIPFHAQNYLGDWRLIINMKGDGKAPVFQIFRKRKGHGSLEYEWKDCEGKVLALEVVAGTSLHEPKLEIKDLGDRRLLHALVLAWVTVVWWDAKEVHLKSRAREISRTLSVRQKFDLKIHGTSKVKGLIS
ncbi:hypothetical protein BT63DRAFT_423235 [Microthyrium microscopicum]|uniref:Uncharacterized protein n=1 Tax=Microthyrium microscopicum TaxID=703497 RepID=A0A6A6UGM9_9PEZI|nr:hypothetical protein BT63DRAFT_423235 [Microthyrium microscopicum]